jgi:hypothetical protein
VDGPFLFLMTEIYIPIPETVTLHEGDVLTVVVDPDKETIEDIKIDDGQNENFDGWFCIKTDPYKCPVCNEFVFFCTVDHKIIVFPEKDHPKLLQLAAWAKGNNPRKLDRNPKVIEYEKSFGPCVSFYAFEFITHS